MIWAHRLLVLSTAKLVSLLSELHQEVHAEVADEVFGLLVDAR